MLQHFKYKPMFENRQLPGWTISFFYKNERIEGEYHPDGSITWLTEAPKNETDVKKMIHELMLFHVYD
ncbi:YheE family protein [Indiicoccus explosivorum]|uniref:YheE family protein n=1 Tax=Indiicoccus explosivorum TaxID=1917864 RepID=UPI000B445D94|nr:YheE family protein [Indiicoccus explosivorum]